MTVKGRCAFFLYHFRIIGIVLNEAFEMKKAVFIHALEIHARLAGANPNKPSLNNEAHLRAQYKLYALNLLSVAHSMPRRLRFHVFTGISCPPTIMQASNIAGTRVCVRRSAPMPNLQ
jgi:hypothetical protein